MPAEIKQLPNGIRIVCETRPNTGSVAMRILIKAGSQEEAAEEHGLTNLTQEATNGGTLTRSRVQLAEEAAMLGSGISSATLVETTTFYTQALTRNAPKVFDLMADMVLNPAFVPEEIEQAKREIAQELVTKTEEPSLVAADKFFEAAFGTQGLARDPLGEKELLASFTQAQLRRRHAEMLAHPENIVISFAGDIDSATAYALAEKYFAALPPATTPVAVVEDKFIGGDIRSEGENEQLNLVLGFKGVSRHDQRMFTAHVLQDYLSGGMSSPLFVEVRENRGLAYQVGARAQMFDTDGFFSIVAGTSEGNAEKLIPVALDLLGNIAREGITQDDIDLARERILRTVEADNEKAGDTAAINAHHIITRGEVVTPEAMDNLYRQVTPESVRRLCFDMLKDGLYAFSAVGPQEGIPAPEEIAAMMKARVRGIIDLPPASQTPVKVAAPAFNTAVQETYTENPARVTVLRNGMRVVTTERSGLLACGAWVGVGSASETAALNGATHMNEHMMFKGTRSYAPGYIERAVEREFKGDLNAATGRDSTSYYFYNLKPESLEKVIDICGEMVFEANIDHDEFNGKNGEKGERDVVIEEILKDADSVSDMAADMLYARAYPEQPYGRTTLGTEESVRALTVEALRAYRDEYYVPGNIVFSATGPIRHEDFVALIEKKYGHMPARDMPATPKPVFQGGVDITESKMSAMCETRLGMEMDSARTDNILERDANGTLVALLAGGDSSRLSSEIILKRQLTSDLFVMQNTDRHAGLFEIGTSLEAKDVKTFIATAYDEIRRLSKDLTQKELDKVKAMAKLGSLLAREANMNVCEQQAEVVLMGATDLNAHADVAARLQRVTVEEVKRAAQRLLEAKPVFAAVVPEGTERSHFPSIEEVIAMRDGKFNEIKPSSLKKTLDRDSSI